MVLNSVQLFKSKADCNLKDSGRSDIWIRSIKKYFLQYYKNSRKITQTSKKFWKLWLSLSIKLFNFFRYNSLVEKFNVIMSKREDALEKIQELDACLGTVLEILNKKRLEKKAKLVSSSSLSSPSSDYVRENQTQTFEANILPIWKLKKYILKALSF